MIQNMMLIDFYKILIDGGLALVKAVLVFILGFILIKIISKLIRTWFSKSKISPIVKNFLLSLINFALNLILILIIFQIIGIPATSLIALLTAAGLAVGLALQNSLSNLANGILIISSKYFEIGDYISVNSMEGTVVSIKMLTTIISTPDNKEIIIPNSTIANNPVINFSRNKTRAIILTFNTAVNVKIDKVKNILTEVMQNNKNVKKTPIPMVWMKEINKDALIFSIKCWCDSKLYLNTQSEILETVLEHFKKNRIKLPVNQLEIKQNIKNINTDQS